MDNNQSNTEDWVPVQENSQGTQTVPDNSSIENWVPVDAPHNTGETSYDAFRETKPQQEESTGIPEIGSPQKPPNPKEGQSRDASLSSPKESLNSPKQPQTAPKDNIESVHQKFSWPFDKDMNAILDSAVGASWNTFVKPVTGKDDKYVDAYLEHINKAHPIATVIGGTAPFIATAPLIPGGLVGLKALAAVSTQFSALSMASAVGTARTTDKDKTLGENVKNVAVSGASGAVTGAIWHFSAPLGWIARAFSRAVGTTGVSIGDTALKQGGMTAIYGDNLVESFRQGGIIGALSLIFENPILAKSPFGRGLASESNHYNSKHEAEWTKRQEDMQQKREEFEPGKVPFNQTVPGEKVDFPGGKLKFPIVINPDEQDHNKIKESILHTVNNMSQDIPQVSKPQVVAATVKLHDGTEVSGTSHADALSKINRNSDGHVDLFHGEGKTDEEIYTGTQYPVAGKGKYYATNERDAAKYGEKITSHKMDIGKFLTFKDDGDLFKFARENKIDFTEPNTLTKEQAIKQAEDLKAAILHKGYKGLVVEVPENPSEGEFLKHAFGHDQVVDYSKESGYEEGYTVHYPDGTAKFITKKEAEEQFGIKKPEDVKGLSESKFTAPAEEPKIVNPETIRQMNEKGGIDVNLIPGVAEAAEVLQRSHAELKEKFTPPEIGQEAQFTAATIRENLGVLARSQDQLENALSAASKLFNKASKESSLDFIYNMEEGKTQSTPELEKVARTLRSILDTKRDEIRALGTGKLENFIENYFPHVWESPNKAVNVIKRIMGKRPFEGTKSFLKKRTIPTTREGVELGLTPVSYNPIDSVMLKAREMDRYLMAQRSIQALKEQGLIKFVRPGAELPEGFVKIDDRFADVVGKNEAGELIIRGKYMAQKDAARILNNYLSPGLAGKSYIYDMYRGAGNNMNQFQLGLSAFHLGFTSMDATISKFALGINKLSTGDFAGAIKEFGRAPFAPITNIMQGRDLLQAWYGKDKGLLTNTVAELMATGGGRAKMDKFYATGMKESMSKAIKEGKLATAAFKVPFYIVEQVARPIMEYIVPRQKMGVFMDLMKMELERNPNASHQEMRGIAQRAWDSVDNRMGQLVYDNLFWNKTMKDLGMASVRSLGWNLGTIREIGGGTKDIIGNVNDVIHGKGTKLSYRTAYVMALPIVTGLYGAIYQYLHTGQGPQELKDYFFPKTGAIDNKGQEARISFPTYMKDLYHYTSNPVQTVINKFSPVNNTVMEMIANKDFYGTEIVNVDDPIMRQVIDEAKFLGTQFVPFGFRNQNRDTRTSLTSKVEPFIGLTPAPHDINMTKAERVAADLAHAKIPVGSRTKEQAAHSQGKSQLRSQYMASKDVSVLNDGVAQGLISAKEKKSIIKESSMSNLERLTQHLTFEEVEHVMKKATKEEKPELEKILEKKRKGKMQRGTWTDSEEALYAKSLESKE